MARGRLVACWNAQVGPRNQCGAQHRPRDPLSSEQTDKPSQTLSRALADTASGAIWELGMTMWTVGLTNAIHEDSKEQWHLTWDVCHERERDRNDMEPKQFVMEAAKRAC